MNPHDPQQSAPCCQSTQASLVLMVGAGLRDQPALSQTLARAGMHCLWLATVAQALDAARLARIDALVLERAAVDGSGAAGLAVALAGLRPVMRCPILVVAPQAAEADEVDEIIALELGADAFLVPPLSPRRLRAHLLAGMRRHGVLGQPWPGAMPPMAPAKAWALDPIACSLTVAGRHIDLTAGQLALLQCLADAQGRVVTASQLTAALPGGEQLAAHSVHVYIGRLRRRLVDEGVHELRVEAVRGRGFVLRSLIAGPTEAAGLRHAA